MAFGSYLLVLNRAVRCLGFTLLRGAYLAVQRTIWFVTGTARKVKDAKRMENYERCAHVLDIQLFYAFDAMVSANLTNFICTHNRFESPRYIFDNDHVTLVTIDDEYAIFGEARVKGMQLWKLEYNAFVKLAQLQFCNRLILVPLEHFHRMADELGDPKVDIVFLFSMGRCGSTLVTQMMENTGACVSISEPGPLLSIFSHQLNKKDPTFITGLCRDAVRWICRPVGTDTRYHFYFIKVSPSCMSLLPIINDAFPRGSYLFMYRNVQSVALSVYKMLQELPAMFVLSVLTRLSGTLRRKLLAKFGLAGASEGRDAVWNDMILGVIGYIQTCDFYTEYRRRGLRIAGVRYEDLVTHPRYAITAVFDYCGISDALVDKSLMAMSSDSQKNSPLSVEKLKKHRSPQFTPESRRFADQLLSKRGLPLIGEEILLEGTITLQT